MKIDNQKILIAIVAITLLLFPIAVFTTGPLRVALGLPFVLFFPGYALLSALFPEREDLGDIERLAFSLGLSIAVVPLIGLVLNYTPWGIQLYPILISITLFIVVAAAIAWYRQRGLPEADRLHFALSVRLPDWASTTRLDKALSVSLVVAVVVALGSLGYVAATPQQGDKFTEFYILNTEGKAQDYPRQVVLGEAVYLIVGVVNHEYQPASYRVGITIDGVENKEVNTGTLAHEEKWEERVSFTPQRSGGKQKVEFWLYKDSGAEPYFADPLQLYIDVIEP